MASAPAHSKKSTYQTTMAGMQFHSIGPRLIDPLRCLTEGIHIAVNILFTQLMVRLIITRHPRHEGRHLDLHTFGNKPCIEEKHAHMHQLYGDLCVCFMYRVYQLLPVRNQAVIVYSHGRWKGGITADRSALRDDQPHPTPGPRPVVMEHPLRDPAVGIGQLCAHSRHYDP